MAILYVNSITGLDANNGSTWALAKKTLASVNTAAAAGDTIYVHGIFSEVLPVSKNLTWIGHGHAALDGAGGLSGSANSVIVNLIGIIFKNFVTVFASGNNPGTVLSIFNCRFEDCGRVFTWNLPNYSMSGSVRNSSFVGCTVAAVEAVSSGGLSFENCAFSGNAIDFKSTGGTFGQVRNCTMRSPQMVNILSAGAWSALSDWNAFDFSVGKCVVNAVDKTTLAAWQAAATSPKDLTSIDRVWSADVGDYANGVLRSNPAGYLLTAVPGSTPIGLQLPALTVSNNRNASLWTGGVFSNCELDGSGYLVLSAGQTVGTYKTDVIDFGAALNAKSIEISLAGEGLNVVPYVDYDTADSPGYYNVRVRGSNTSFLKADASPSWVIVPRRAEIGAYMSNALRYWQVELTLRA